MISSIPSGGMNSSIYKGWVSHRRVAPTQNAFRYRIFMLYVDLAELPRLFDGVPFWSSRRRALAWFKRSDYLGPADVPLDTAVRALVHERTGTRPSGPIRLLTHLRYFGYCMNPVSFYYCFDDSGSRLQTIVAEITNTPWKERHQYVLAVNGDLDAGADHDAAGDVDVDARGERAGGQRLRRFEFGKAFHVSPFMPMDMQYRWNFNDPGEGLNVSMQNFRHGVPIFDATLALRREPVSARALVRVLAGFPLMTLRVVTAIHWQAFKLWCKRTPFYSHPPSLT